MTLRARPVSVLAAFGAGTVPVLVTVWIAALAAAFLWWQRADLLALLAAVHVSAASLAGGALASADGLVRALAGAGIALLIALCWLGAGSLAFAAVRAPRGEEEAPRGLRLAERIVAGAGLWSLAWVLLGLAGLYWPAVAVGALGAGLVMAGLALRRQSLVCRDGVAFGDRAGPAPWSIRSVLPAGWPAGVAPPLVVLVLGLAAIAALAPPTAKDTLLYHLAVPKAWVQAGSGIEVPGNVASFYPLGAQVQSVWALLLGGLGGRWIGEAAAMLTLFAWAPLLLGVVHGWTRERGLGPAWAWTATLMVASIPLVHHVAASGYADLALSATFALVVRAAGRWWTTGDDAWLVRVALALGLAMAIKPTAVFVAGPLALVLAAGAYRRRAPWRVAVRGGAALAGAAALASPWYVRNWARTGNPVYPFAVDLLGGAAAGWDAERARLYEAFFGLWGGADRGIVEQALAPIRVALVARLEDPARYDGVLGVAMLAGLPLVLWAIWRRRLDAEVLIAGGLSAATFVAWLHASQQLRYLLPAVPGWTLASVAAAAALTGAHGGARLVRGAMGGAALAGLAVTFAWFAEADPLRAALGGEPRATYLARRLDHYSHYQVVNRDLGPGARVWLINVRRDSYHLERAYMADFIFEDWTLRNWVREAPDAGDLRARAREAGLTHVLVRPERLYDYRHSPIVDERLPPEENLARLRRMDGFFREGTRLLSADRRLWLIELPPPP